MSWYGSKAFALHCGLDLPTEAEWEYAARGGMQYKYGTDDGTIDSSKANYNDNVGHTTDVGSYPSNPFGLYDICGNVSEWCNDWYDTYSSGAQTDPVGPSSGYYRVHRGHGWWSDAWSCRSAYRKWSTLTYTNGNVGFRVVRRP